MSEASPPSPASVTDLQASAHLMRLETGVYCIYHSPASPRPDPQTGLPGVRVSLPPGANGGHASIAGFRDDGWLDLNAAALVRVTQGPTDILVTVYQSAGANQPPRLQVTNLGVGTPAAPVHAAGPPAVDAELWAHLQHRGDVLAPWGSWVGEPGSQRWVEGFSLSPAKIGIAPEDIEYQAVLGRDWLSPWATGAEYCGSRGMALPILGLRVRLRGTAAATYAVQLSATFTDGTTVGPVGSGEACEAGSLAPLEAFRVEILPLPHHACEAMPPKRKPKGSRG